MSGSVIGLTLSSRCTEPDREVGIELLRGAPLSRSRAPLVLYASTPPMAVACVSPTQLPRRGSFRFSMSSGVHSLDVRVSQLFEHAVERLHVESLGELQGL